MPSLREWLPPARRQTGQRCEAFNAVAMLEATRRKAGLPAPTLSGEYADLIGRAIDGLTPTDNLSPSLRAVMRGLILGCARESVWPAGGSGWPSGAAMADAADYRALAVEPIAGITFSPNPYLDNTKRAIDAGQFVVLGVRCTSSFVSAPGGVVPHPQTGTDLGGHAVLLYGYDEPSRRFLFQTSWGPGWGDGTGCGTLSYDALTQFGATQPWTCRVGPAVVVPPATEPKWTVTASAQANPAANAIDGDNYRTWWSARGSALPQWIEISFGKARALKGLTIYSVQDDYQNPVPPTDAMTFSKWGCQDFKIEIRVSGAWDYKADVKDSNRVKLRIEWSAPVSCDAIRITVTRTPDGFARIAEIAPLFADA